MSQKDIGNKIPIYKLKAGKEVEDYYDEWTVQNKYDKDMVDWKYSGPQETIDLFKKHNSKKDIWVQILQVLHLTKLLNYMVQKVLKLKKFLK